MTPCRLAPNMVRHMEAVEIAYPPGYNAIVAKVRSLHEAA